MAKGVLLGMLAETPLHPGAGQSAGVVDLPVAREGATGLPHIPETGLKGALKQWARECGAALDIDRLFGKTDAGEEQSPSGTGDERVGAGELVISTARLLCLPVRRLDGPYAWATCPYLLERLERDSTRVGHPLHPPKLAPKDSEQEAELLVADGSTATIFLEEYCFTPKPVTDTTAIANSVGKLIDEAELSGRLCRQIAVMSDKEFSWFAEHGLPVDARNQLDDSKISRNLWYEETIPPDALFYALILPRSPGPGRDGKANQRWNQFIGALKQATYVQVGGNETVGHGWVRLALLEA